MTEPGLSPNERHQLQQRYRHLQAQVAQLGWIARGSLMPKAPRAWRLTRKVRGKTVTLALSAARADAFRQAIANHRRLEELLHEMRQLSEIALLGPAPGVKKRPRPGLPGPNRP
jgi:hypothetical protein